MTPEQFHRWRRHLGMTQAAAGKALGLGVTTIRNYERGCRPDGRPAPIPRTTELACAAVALGIKRYSGPDA